MIYDFSDERSFRHWFEGEEVYSEFGVKDILVSQEEFRDPFFWLHQKAQSFLLKLN